MVTLSIQRKNNLCSYLYIVKINIVFHTATMNINYPKIINLSNTTYKAILFIPDNDICIIPFNLS